MLTDSQQRAKYDVTRKSGGGRYTGASGVRGNPWSNVSQQYPTPPRRNNNPSARNTTTSGADRWNQRFSSGVPPTARAHAGASNGAETKKNAASAFEKMRTPKAPPPPTPPRAEYARQRAEASFGGRAGSRTSGYQPSATTYGDEPPVSNSNYTTRRDTSSAHPQPAAPPKPQAAPMPDPLRQFREEGDPRMSSPYTTQSGEKTNPFDGTNVGRSKSTRETSSRPASGYDEVPRPAAPQYRPTTEQNGSSVPSHTTEAAQAPGQGRSRAQTTGEPSRKAFSSYVLLFVSYANAFTTSFQNPKWTC